MNELFEAVMPFINSISSASSVQNLSSDAPMLEVGSSSGSKAVLSLPEPGVVPPSEHRLLHHPKAVLSLPEPGVVPPSEHRLLHHPLGLSSPLVPPGVILAGYSEWVLNAQWVTDLENILGDLILDLRRADRMRAPGPDQLEHIVYALTEDNGGAESLPAIIRDLREKGRESRFYADSQEIYNKLKWEGLTDALLRKENTKKI